MEVQKEAQRIMTMSVWKMYHSRLQRGGLRLHHSLQLSLVMRSARELYLSAKLEEEEEEEGGGAGALREEEGAAPGQPPLQGAVAAPGPPPAEERTPGPAGETPPGAGEPEPMETQESSGGLPQPPAPAPRVPPAPAGKASRKRRSSSLDKPGAVEAGLVPTKKARLEAAAEEEEEEAAARGPPQPQGQEGRFPSLAKVLQSRFSGVLLSGPPKGPDPTPGCRPGDGVLSILVRAVVAF